MSEIDELGSVIVALGNNMGTTEKRIARASARFAGIASNAGFATSEILALGGVVTEARRRVEGGATAIQRFVKFMNQAATTGGEDLENLADVAGMTADQFRQTFEKSAPEALEAFLQGLGRAGEQGQSMSEVLSNMDLNAEILQATLVNLAQNSERVGQATQIANNAQRENNALTQEANQFYNTFFNQLKQTWNIVREIATAFGRDLLPSIKNMNQSLQDTIGIVKNMSVEMRTRIMKIATLIGAGGPLAFAIGKLMSVFATLFRFVTSRVALLTLPFAAAMVATQNYIDNLTGTGANTRAILTKMRIYWKKWQLDILEAVQGTLQLFGGYSDSIKKMGENVRKDLQELGMEFGILKRNIGQVDVTSFKESMENLGRKALDVGKMFADAFLGKIGVNEFMREIENARALSDYRQRLAKNIRGIQHILQGGIPGVDAMVSDLQRLQTETSLQDRFSGVQNILQGGIPGLEGIKEIPKFTKKISPALKEVRSLAMKFTQSFGQGLSNVIVGAKSLTDVLENMGKLILSTLIQKGLMLLMNTILPGSGSAAREITDLAASSSGFSAGPQINNPRLQGMSMESAVRRGLQGSSVRLEGGGRDLFLTLQQENERRGA